MHFSAIYGHFAAGIGTIVLVLLGFSILTDQPINFGPLELSVFPALAALYALYRSYGDHKRESAYRARLLEVQQLKQRIAQLEADRMGSAES